MAYINSNNIEVFPCGGRFEKFDPLARFTTEYNLVSLINRLVDKNSFIVTNIEDHVNMADSQELFQFNIGGYLFTVKTGFKGILKSLEGTGTGKYIIAKINVQNYANYMQLAPYSSVSSNIESYNPNILDESENDNSQFFGVYFEYSASWVENSNTSLTLFENKNNGWYCYQDSKVKFETTKDGRNSIRIDDGEI